MTEVNFGAFELLAANYADVSEACETELCAGGWDSGDSGSPKSKIQMSKSRKIIYIGYRTKISTAIFIFYVIHSQSNF